MPRKIDHKRVTFNASFGIGPDQLAKEINALPLTARVLAIDTTSRPGAYHAYLDITYYTQPEKADNA